MQSQSSTNQTLRTGFAAPSLQTLQAQRFPAQQQGFTAYNGIAGRKLALGPKVDGGWGDYPASPAPPAPFQPVAPHPVRPMLHRDPAAPVATPATGAQPAVSLYRGFSLRRTEPSANYGSSIKPSAAVDASTPLLKAIPTTLPAELSAMPPMLPRVPPMLPRVPPLAEVAKYTADSSDEEGCGLSSATTFAHSAAISTSVDSALRSFFRCVPGLPSDGGSATDGPTDPILCSPMVLGNEAPAVAAPASFSAPTALPRRSPPRSPVDLLPWNWASTRNSSATIFPEDSTFSAVIHPPQPPTPSLGKGLLQATLNAVSQMAAGAAGDDFMRFGLDH